MLAAFTINSHYVADAGIDFASGVIRQHGIYKPLIQPQLFPVHRHLEHVVNVRIDRSAMDFGSAF